MSTILKALRRLEQEKTGTGERPPLREELVVVRAPSRRRAAWWVLGGAAVLASVATFAFLRELRGALPDASADLPMASRGAAASGAGLDAAPPSGSLADRPAARPDVTRPGVAPAVPQAAAAVSAPPPSPSAAAMPLPIADPLPTASDDPARLGARDPEVVVVRPMEGRPSRVVEEDAPVVARRPEAAAGREGAARPSRQLTPIRVVRTSWHPLPERRAAWVEWDGEGVREVREGGRVGPYQVREIEPEAVLFADGAALVRKRIGGR